ncbi:antibiotic biosynthesis monooxygenase [Vibrio sp. 10N.286.49.C2]|uniref:putative quinol monooxygenase n=1 Tax=unclassified Vibrio TaxID=2614977 RepID=UPI000C85A8EB|nr:MULTISPECIES: antibiotic biosynthesis monooxygenase [unclassified Vibrio]PMH31466.1 antibiotic biosynthesis monooxygenase [Vibrio sp. 10N.286.49.C2]PMH50487.1 antibiotic biosynthesis monooxygenase [Vibrio sp. 10N.286.49.B1]PMH78031.1 antibiotic biosynthesis monooxygenase [Vibrio sp. 10N.286.48.B7]
MTSRVYVLAQFKPKTGKEAELFEVLKALEPDSYREEGCIQYTVTRQIKHPSATNNDFSIVFNEVWRDAEAWAAHGRRQQIQHFFESQVQSETGLVADVMVTAYSDEGHNFDQPIFK